MDENKSHKITPMGLSQKNNTILGIDVGASGIKAALVDPHTGTLLSERIRFETPQPATPQAIADTAAQATQHLQWTGPVGCGFPAIIKSGIAHSAANIHESCIGANIQEIFTQTTGCPTDVANDADVAGLAEATFGAGKNQPGTLLLITIGSGLGSALINNGQLIPNTELGHLQLHNQLAEHYASASARKRDGLSWEEWGIRFNQYLSHLAHILCPNLFILGGGGSKKFHKYQHQLTQHIPIVPAQLLNNAGIVGAAIYAHQKRATANQPEAL